MKRLISVVITVALLCCASFCLIACDKGIDYGKDNSFEIEVIEDKDAVTYLPVGVEAKYGFLFYLGTAIEPEYYDYLAKPLAKQGYAVVISNVLLAYFQYQEKEPAFEKYPNIEFFIGGHSQGGGAAVRRAQENLHSVKGVILYAPLCMGEYTLKESSLPTLLLEATKDGVLAPNMKADAKTRLPDARTEYMLEGCHMSFSSFDEDGILALFSDGPVDDEVKAMQKEQTVAYTLAFLRSVAVQGKGDKR